MNHGRRKFELKRALWHGSPQRANNVKEPSFANTRIACSRNWWCLHAGCGRRLSVCFSSDCLSILRQLVSDVGFSRRSWFSKGNHSYHDQPSGGVILALAGAKCIAALRDVRPRISRLMACRNSSRHASDLPPILLAVARLLRMRD